MGRKRGTREKILYRFDKAEDVLRRAAGYMKEIQELASCRSVVVTGKTPPILNGCLEMADVVRDVGDQFRKE